MLVSRLALIDTLRAPTVELRAQHRYKMLVVQTSDLPRSLVSNTGNEMFAETANTSKNRRRGKTKGGATEVCTNYSSQVTSTGALSGPGILAVGAERGRTLRDTRLETSFFVVAQLTPHHVIVTLFVCIPQAMVPLRRLIDLFHSSRISTLLITYSSPTLLSH